MRPEAQTYLHDIAQAIEQIASYTAGKAFADYEGNSMLRSAVERQLEIAGEALRQLASLDEALAARVREHRRIIAFRNILAHGYASVDNRLVWDIVQTKLAALGRMWHPCWGTLVLSADRRAPHRCWRRWPRPQPARSGRRCPRSEQQAKELSTSQAQGAALRAGCPDTPLLLRPCVLRIM